MDRKAIKEAFLNSKEYDTIIDPKVLFIYYDMDRWWIDVDDYFYESHDPLAARNFSVEICIVDGQEQLCFEEV